MKRGSRTKFRNTVPNTMYMGNITSPIPRINDWKTKNMKRNTKPKDDTRKYTTASSYISGPAPMSRIKWGERKYPTPARITDTKNRINTVWEELWFTPWRSRAP